MQYFYQSFDFPGGPAVKEVIHTMDGGFRHHFLDLVAYTVIIGYVLHVPYHPEGYRIMGAFHIGKRHLETDIVDIRIVDENVIDSVSTLSDMYGAYLPPVIDESVVLVLAEHHLLTLAEDDRMVCADGRVGKIPVGTVVEDDAVREEFHYGATVVKGGRSHYLLVEGHLHVEGAREESSLGTQHQGAGFEWMLDSSVRGCLGNGSKLRSWAVLSFRQTIDLIVEEHYVDIDVPADRMDEMVSSNGQGVTVSTGLPYGKPWIGHLDARGYRSGASMYTVETVGIHIIRKTGGASYSGNDDISFLIVVESLAHLGEGSLKGGKHRMVPAAGTPAHFLVALEILESKICHITVPS